MEGKMKVCVLQLQEVIVVDDCSPACYNGFDIGT